MYLRGLKALDPSVISAGMSLFSSFMNRGGGGGAPGAPSLGPAVNTTVQTTVSPQISPVFVQQDSPSNSPVNAATQQIAPAPQTATQGVPTAAGGAMPYTPMTGAIPGVDYASGYAPTGTPMLPAGTGSAPLPMSAILAGGGIILAAVLLRGGRGKRGAKGARR